MVYDFRAADVAAGGQGAPLVPVFHRALVRSSSVPHPVAVLNLGGVANVTFVDGDAISIACDTGPGNALIDDFMRAADRRSRATTTDARRRRARSTRTRSRACWRIRSSPSRRPKSLDRNAFRALGDGRRTARREKHRGRRRDAHGAHGGGGRAHATKVLPRAPAGWIVAGGGARNPTLMRMLAQRLAPASVETADAVGWSADALEAQAFAFLAVRTLKGLPLTFPTTTGVPRPLTGGVLVRKSDGASVPPRA